MTISNSEMHELIDAFPNNLKEALKIAKTNPLEKSYPKFDHIVICGLGGSGIGGKLVSGWFRDQLPIPVELCQTYELPKYVGKRTLLIASSYSGNTEETLSAVEEGHKKGAYILAITSGGKLAEFCCQFNYEFILIPSGNPPRTQLAYSIVQLTHFLSELDLIKKEMLNEFDTAANRIEEMTDAIRTEAKSIASFCFEKNLILYSDAKDEAIAIRARQQFNENSKILCSHHVIPEMNHNELVGWAGGDQNNAVLAIHTGDLHPQNTKRFEYSRNVIESRTKHYYELSVDSGSNIVRSLCLINILDWASYYLAELREVDAVEVEVITGLKNSLV